MQFFFCTGLFGALLERGLVAREKGDRYDNIPPRIILQGKGFGEKGGTLDNSGSDS